MRPFPPIILRKDEDEIVGADPTDVTYPELRFALLATDIFLGRDKRTRRFVRHLRSQKES